MLDKLVTEPAELEQHCKYESDIATPPPVNRVALTFDDGPAPGATEFILDLLKKYNISATFFMVGKQAEENPDL
ncbi:polysaccharide deacetylase family protein, partial [Duganella sp. LX47W]|nr:polysaccharide deacetylase family protein [Rugamonas apoptosis]